MHELGIVYQIVKTVDEVKKEQCLDEIKSIKLQIGEMSDVVPRFIEAAWQEVKKSTDYPNARLIIDIIPAKVKCNACGYTDLIKNIEFECPSCKSADFKIISGREFLIEEITAK